MISHDEDLINLESDALAHIAAAQSVRVLDQVQAAILGSSGSLTKLLRTLGSIPLEERRVLGPKLNIIKGRIEESLVSARAYLKRQEIHAALLAEKADITLPVSLGPYHEGRIHPISQAIDEAVHIFERMGFFVADGPEIENDYYNFTALNFQIGHPAREMHDTFFLQHHTSNEKLCLRTHTSPVQIRSIEKWAQSLNSDKNNGDSQYYLRIIAPGRVYRCDSDKTHAPMFHQLEGLVIEDGVDIGSLKWLLFEFCKAFFGLDHVDMRFRPSFFPFTEPSMEVDIRCDRSGSTLTIGKGSDWLEILGCGMVHPNVLANCGLDPDRYRGFAWGIGIERLAMLKHQIPDIRDFYSGDARWIQRHGFNLFEIPGCFGF